MEIVGITAENTSGFTIKRDGMEEVFSAANKNRMDAVFTGKPDRIARNEPNFSDCIERLDKQGIELLTLNAGVVNSKALLLISVFRCVILLVWYNETERRCETHAEGYL